MSTQDTPAPPMTDREKLPAQELDLLAKLTALNITAPTARIERLETALEAVTRLNIH